MGYSSWSDKDYTSRAVKRKATTGHSHFGYDANIKSGSTVAKVHKDLDPNGVTRESRDSTAHPNSRAVAVIFDETGSMGTIPVVLQKKLAKLMGVLNTKAYLEDPQVLFAAVGDARSDRAPLQVGQFESGAEMDDDLNKFYLEGNGGGQHTESYDLALYFADRHMVMDCVEKRGDKGYLFIIGDEDIRDVVRKTEVKSVMGDDLQSDLETAEVVDSLRDKFEVFVIRPTGGWHGNNKQITEHWQKYFPERVLMMDNPDEICELIAAQIGVTEGVVDIDGAVRDVDGGVSVKNALVVSGSTNTGLVSVGSVEGELDI